MPKYRVYLSEGRQIDIDADEHTAVMGEKNQLSRVDFFDSNGKPVASFSALALHGYTRTENLACQKDKA